MDESYIVSLYVIKNANGEYFSKFDPVAGKPIFVRDPLAAKKYTNKYDVKLRPDEALQELRVDLSKVKVDIMEPFRPYRRRRAGNKPRGTQVT